MLRILLYFVVRVLCFVLFCCCYMLCDGVRCCVGIIMYYGVLHCITCCCVPLRVVALCCVLLCYDVCWCVCMIVVIR